MLEHKNSTIGWQCIFDLMKPFKLHIVVLSIVGIVWSVFTVLKAYFLKIIIDQLVESGDDMLWPIVMYMGAWIVSEGFLRLRDFTVMYFKPYLKKHITTVFFKRMLKYDDYYFQQNQPSALTNGLRNLYDGVDDGIYIGEELFSHCILIISSLAGMYIIKPTFSVVTLIWFVVWALLARIWAKKGHTLAFVIGEIRTKLNFNLGDVFSNISTTKVCSAILHENEINEAVSQEIATVEVVREKMFLKVWIAQGILFLGVFALVFYVLLKGYENGSITVGDFAMLIELLHGLYLYLFDFAKDVSEFSEVTGKVLQGLNVIYKDLEPEIPNLPSLISTHGEIILDKVHYRYPGTEAESGFSSSATLKIKGGSTVALVGPSGGGKSTLVKLLLRLFDPTSGKILIDGQDIAERDIASVRRAFAFVPQELGLFHRSIKENISYGSFDASDEEIIVAAKKAKIHDVIMELPSGYNTIFGVESGLSGGQKQRIMIARGLLRNAKIFLFDESTSALDAKTEHDILASIRETTQGCTKIIVAHRLNTVKNADVIFVCDKGEIIEQGDHAQLMNENGLYSSLVSLI